MTESSLHTGSVPRRSARGPRPGSLAPPSVAPQLARKASKPGTPAQWPGPLSPEGGLWARRGHAPVGVRGRVCERKGCFGRAVSGSDSNGNTQPFCGSCMLPGAAGLTNSPMQWLLLMSPSVRCGRRDHQGPKTCLPGGRIRPGHSGRQRDRMARDKDTEACQRPLLGGAEATLRKCGGAREGTRTRARQSQARPRGVWSATPSGSGEEALRRGGEAGSL